MARVEAAGKTGVTGAISESTTGKVTIRKCEALEEMQACFALQKEVWKFSDADLVPVRMFVVAAKIGGQVVGAFAKKDDARDGERELIGFALAIPGMRNGHCYLHSQMLAVRQQYRNGGLGRRMKLFQREDALARGFELMEWTFDPLECRAGIDVPAEIYEWKAAATTRAQALAVQGSNRERFTRAFAEGLSVLGYERDERGNGRFLLGEWDEGWRY